MLRTTLIAVALAVAGAPLGGAWAAAPDDAPTPESPTQASPAPEPDDAPAPEPDDAPAPESDDAPAPESDDAPAPESDDASSTPEVAPPGTAPAASVERPADEPRIQDPGVEARPWSLLVGGGFSFTALNDTPIGRQLEAAGYGAFAIGPWFSVTVQRYVLDWLVLGGALDLRYAATDTGSDPYSGSLLPNQSSELWRLGAAVYVQPTVCLEYGSCKHEGFWMGLQVGAAFGPTWWVLRDEADLGWHVRLEAAIVWQGGIGDVIVGFRLLHALVWQSGMGPRDLGMPFTWLPTMEVQLGYRW